MAISITKPSVGTTTGWGDVLNTALDTIVAGVNAQAGTFEPVGRAAQAIYDDFTRYADGALAGATPLTGSAWSTTGANPTAISGGKATSAGTGYLYQAMTAQPSEMWCDISWSGSDPTIAAMTMAMSSDVPLTLANLLHFNFSATGFNCTLRANTGSFDGFGLYGNWVRPMKLDGTKYRVRFAVIGETAVIHGPNGEQFAASDPRVKTLGGRSVFWEPGSIVSMYACGAVATASSGKPSPYVGPGHAAAAGFLVDHGGRAVGNRDTFGQASVGLDAASGFPAVMFGPETVYATVTTAVSSGTSLVLDRAMPSGTVVTLEPGANSETVTTTGFPGGTGPYTHALTSSVTKSHAIGVVAAGAVPSSGRGKVYFDYRFGSLYTAHTWNFTGGSLVLGTDATYIERASTGVVKVTSAIKLNGSAAGVTHYSGSGAPALAAALGDAYWRTDGGAGTWLYRCTTGGSATTGAWTAVI